MSNEENNEENNGEDISTISQYFNRVGKAAIENATSPVYLGTMCVLAAISVPFFGKNLVTMILALPTVMYGVGFLSQKAGHIIEKFEDKPNP